MLKRLLPLALLAAVVASSCSTFEATPAATVNGTEISADSIQDELKVIKDNDAYKKALENSFGTESKGAGSGTYDAQFVAQLISLRVYYELLDQELEERGVKLSDDDVLAARETVEQQLQSIDVKLESFPKAYQDRMARQEALVEKIQATLSKDVQSPEDYYRDHRDQFEEACVSHILVSSQTRSPEEALTAAQALKARIDQGEDFAAVAKAESEDPGSAANGGDLGQCFDRTAQLVPEFLQAAFEQPVGQVSDPVQTQYGYHLILVRSRKVPEFDEVRDKVQAALQNQSGNLIPALLPDLACKGDITVSPRYGQWDDSQCDEGLPRVVPPAQPTTTTAVAPKG